MHQHNIEDARGNLADVIPFCSDSCHWEWCTDNDQPYDGWDGCHESPDYASYCAQCGVIASAGPDGCEHQRDNVVVNRFTREDGEMCEHGNWVQLPARMLART
jgi:hypothetical protein